MAASSKMATLSLSLSLSLLRAESQKMDSLYFHLFISFDYVAEWFIETCLKLHWRSLNCATSRAMAEPVLLHRSKLVLESTKSWSIHQTPRWRLVNSLTYSNWIVSKKTNSHSVLNKKAKLMKVQNCSSLGDIVPGKEKTISIFNCFLNISTTAM